MSSSTSSSGKIRFESIHSITMNTLTLSSASNPRPASRSQDDGVRIPDMPLRGSLSPVTNAQPQRQVMKLPSVTVPVLPSSSTSDPQDDLVRHDVTDPEDVRFPAAKSAYPLTFPLSKSSLMEITVLKIMKKALPADAKIAKPAKEDVERYAVEFIQFLTSEGLSNPSVCATLMYLAKLTLLPFSCRSGVRLPSHGDKRQ